jgi:hypothetical protein
VVPTGCVIVSVTPRDEDNVTVAPVIGLLPPSRTVTVIVLTEMASAVTEDGAAETVEVEADALSRGTALVSFELALSCPAPKARMT